MSLKVSLVASTYMLHMQKEQVQSLEKWKPD